MVRILAARIALKNTIKVKRLHERELLQNLKNVSAVTLKQISCILIIVIRLMLLEAGCV
jgi:hypothetical protein